MLPLIYQAIQKSREYNKESVTAWWLFFAAQFCMLLMDVLWVIFNMVFVISTSATPILLLYIIHVFLFSLGLLNLPHVKTPLIPILRRIADIGIVMCIIFIALWSLIVDQIVQWGMSDSFTLMVTITFVILEFAVSYILIGVFLRNAGQLKKRPVSFLLVAGVLQTVSTAAFGFFAMQGAYISGGLSDYLMVISYLMVGAAAVMQFSQEQPKIPVDCSYKARYMNLHLNYHIPAVFGIMAYLLLIWIYIYNPRLFFVMLLTASLVIGLVVFRQILQMEEIKTAQRVAEENSRIAEKNRAVAEETSQIAEENRQIAEKNRKIAEQNEEKFRAIIENSIDAIILVSEANKILKWNQGAERIFGYTSAEALNREIDLIVPPEYSEDYKNGLARAVLRGNFDNGQIFETYGVNKQKEIMPLEQSVTHWHGEEGHVFAAIVRDVSIRRKSEEQLKRSLDEKNLLLLEIHHRVKNHLQIVSSLINLLSFTIDDIKTKNTLLEIQNRIKTIALIHEILYQKRDMSHVDMKSYVGDILKNLSLTYERSQNIDLEFKVDDIYLNMETATPCGLIINELVTNSFKYAFSEGDLGKIFLSLKKENNQFILDISDNGKGLGENFDFNDNKTLGLRLVNNLVRQMSGSIEFNGLKGTSFEIKFKETEYEDRF